MDVNQLIADYGGWFYAITFLWTFLEGETFVIFAGAAAQTNGFGPGWGGFAPFRAPELPVTESRC